MSRRLRIAILVFGLPAVPAAWLVLRPAPDAPNVLLVAGACTTEALSRFVQAAEGDVSDYGLVIEWRAGALTGAAAPGSCLRVDPALAPTVEVRCVVTKVVRTTMSEDGGTETTEIRRVWWSPWIGPPEHAETIDCEGRPTGEVGFWDVPRARVAAR